MTVQLLDSGFGALYLVCTEHQSNTKYGDAAQLLKKGPKCNRQPRKRNEDNQNTEKDKCACAGHELSISGGYYHHKFSSHGIWMCHKMSLQLRYRSRNKLFVDLGEFTSHDHMPY